MPLTMTTMTTVMTFLRRSAVGQTWLRRFSLTRTRVPPLSWVVSHHSFNLTLPRNEPFWTGFRLEKRFSRSLVKPQALVDWYGEWYRLCACACTCVCMYESVSESECVSEWVTVTLRKQMEVCARVKKACRVFLFSSEVGRTWAVMPTQATTPF